MRLRLLLSGGAARRGSSLPAHRCTSSLATKLPEVASAARFASRVDAALAAPAPAAADLATLAHDPERVRLVLRAAMATTHLHTQSRIAAYEGEGYYTIGPCGEELLASVALALRPTDPAALHYRHVGTLVARQLQRGATLERVLLDRARGHTISVNDPVTGGVHCSLGDDPQFDFLVTSTLASQGPQAVGRAVAIEHLPAAQRWPSDAISYVSCGDGSVNNSVRDAGDMGRYGEIRGDLGSVNNNSVRSARRLYERWGEVGRHQEI